MTTYRWKAQSGMTSYDFAAAAIATYEASRNTDPGVENVEDGVTYKIHNVALEGTLEAPTAPTLAAVDDLDGDSATCTVSGSDADGTNKVYYMEVGGSSWTLGTLEGGGDAERTGNGSLVIALTPNKYWLRVTSTADGLTTAGNTVALTIAPAGNAAFLNARAYPRKRGPWATIYLTSNDAWAYESMQLIAKRLGRHRDG